MVWETKRHCDGYLYGLNPALQVHTSATGHQIQEPNLWHTLYLRDLLRKTMPIMLQPLQLQQVSPWDTLPYKIQEWCTPAILMADRLTDDMWSLATQHLVAFRTKLWHGADEIAYSVVPPVTFLPDIVIKKILDNYTLLHSATDLDPIVKNKSHLIPHQDALWQVISAFAVGFMPLQAKVESDKDATKKAKELTHQPKHGWAVNCSDRSSCTKLIYAL